MLAALSASNALVSPFGGYLGDRLGNLLILRTGAGLILTGLILLIFTGPDTSTLGLAARFIVIGLGFGLFQAPISTKFSGGEARLYRPGGQHQRGAQESRVAGGHYLDRGGLCLAQRPPHHPRGRDQSGPECLPAGLWAGRRGRRSLIFLANWAACANHEAAGPGRRFRLGGRGALCYY